MNMPVVLNIAIFIALLILLAQTHRTQWSLSKKVFAGLGLGVAFGLGLHALYSDSPVVLAESMQWFNIVGSGYVKLLQMVVMPLVFISILGAVVRLHAASSLGKISFLSIGTLLITTFIAALVGAAVTNLFGLTAAGLVQGTQETARLAQLNADYMAKVTDLNVPPPLPISLVLDRFTLLLFAPEKLDEFVDLVAANTIPALFPRSITTFPVQGFTLQVAMPVLVSVRV